ncbi:putative pyruvate formate lyase activating enzyme [Thermodesulforhabdus norvegica]|uniref:Putative pyruvate formate lyase activating enzyme n=2 Tax=Thermodesulforhabdus norvegica TaxID=39841 RepID=A0A1I4R111_9BACT|nr:putative pyruvate formate lyase activating enzyme [Thermodesulforhabdus norvegica]
MCEVNRREGKKGRCGAGADVRIAGAFLHFGEEACLVGETGSGAVFFSHCVMRCMYCQTYEMSWFGRGEDLTDPDFLGILKSLVERGCENLNFITPTAYIPHIRWAVEELRKTEKIPPVVYNTGGYESVEALKSLEGIVDIYLTDIKYLNGELAKKLSHAPDYPDIVKVAVMEMYRQVGDLEMNGRGVAKRGLIVRHLVLPGYVEESLKVLEWIAENLSVQTYINVMGHYRPFHLAPNIPELSRTLRRQEYELVISKARELGLTRMDTTHRNLYPLIWEN